MDGGGAVRRARGVASAALRGGAALAVLVLVCACDTRQQKPKVAFELIPPAAAHTNDLVVRPQEVGDAFLLRFGIDAHQEDIALFERHASDGRDPQLKQYAQRTLSSLRAYLAGAQKLVNATAGR